MSPSTTPNTALQRTAALAFSYRSAALSPTGSVTGRAAHHEAPAQPAPSPRAAVLTRAPSGLRSLSFEPLGRSPMRLSHRVFHCLATTILLTTPALSAIAGAYTVEWLVCASDVTAVGKITRTKTVKGPGDLIYEDCVLTVTEPINNASERNVPFCYRRFSGDSVEWLKSGGEFLVCLSVHKTPYDELRVTNPYYHARLNNVLTPTSQHHPRSIIDLSSPERYVMSGHSKLLTTKDQILQTARSASKAFFDYRKSHPDAGIQETIIPAKGEADRVLFAGSATFLIVPGFMFPRAPK